MDDEVVKDALENSLLTRKATLTEVLLHCEVCNTAMNGTASAASHLRGIKHIKKYKQYLAQNSAEGGINILDDEKKKSFYITEDLSDDIKSLVTAKVLEQFVKDGAPYFRCLVCNCYMSGDQTTRSHLQGGAHSKKMANGEVMGGYQSPASSSSRANSSELLLSNFCSTPRRSRTACDEADDSSSPAYQRSSSSMFHPEPMTSTSSLSSLRSSNESINASTSDLSVHEATDAGVLYIHFTDGAAHYRCKVCDLSVTGEVPAQMHLRGSKHKKNVARGAVVMPEKLEIKKAMPMGTRVEDVQAAVSSGVLRVATEHTSPEYRVYRCTLCLSAGVMLGVATTHSHMQGAAHLRALNENSSSSSAAAVVAPQFTTELLRTSLEQSISMIANVDKSSTIHVNDSVCQQLKLGIIQHQHSHGYTSLRCLVCNRNFTGRENCFAHLQGSTHIKALQRRLANDEETSGNYSSSTASLNSEEQLSTMKESEFSLASLGVEDLSLNESKQHWTLTPEHLQASLQKLEPINKRSCSPPQPCKLSSSSEESPPPPQLKTSQKTSVTDVTVGEALSSGLVTSCTVDDLDLDIFVCEACNESSTNFTALKLHLQSQAHHIATRGDWKKWLATRNEPSIDKLIAATAAVDVGAASAAAILTEEAAPAPGNFVVTAAAPEVTYLPASATTALDDIVEVEGDLDFKAQVEEGIVKVALIAGKEFYDCMLCDNRTNAIPVLRYHLISERHKKALRKERGIEETADMSYLSGIFKRSSSKSTTENSSAPAGINLKLSYPTVSRTPQQARTHSNKVVYYDCDYTSKLPDLQFS